MILKNQHYKKKETTDKNIRNNNAMNNDAMNNNSINNDAILRALIENIPQKIFVKDINSVYVSCNQKFALDLGITPEALRGHTDYVFFPEKLANKYREDDKRIIESGIAEEIEEKYINDGQTVWIHTTKTPIRDEDGKAIGILGIFTDITAQKHRLMEKKLRIKEERYSSLVEGINRSNIGLLVVCADRRIRFMNQMLVEEFGEHTEHICYENIGKTNAPCAHKYSLFFCSTIDFQKNILAFSILRGNHKGLPLQCSCQFNYL
ncbi:MAG: PAS domain-containing protein, partial [Desulfamplus sp.]|nr:PAS domain-containing protein [Desulfamplus sp.]